MISQIRTKKGDVALMYKYALIQSMICDDSCKRTCYGIALIQITDNVATIIEEYLDLSQDYDSVKNLIALCNVLDLDRSQLLDIVNDFLSK